MADTEITCRWIAGNCYESRHRAAETCAERLYSGPTRKLPIADPGDCKEIANRAWLASGELRPHHCRIARPVNSLQANAATGGKDPRKAQEPPPPTALT